MTKKEVAQQLLRVLVVTEDGLTTVNKQAVIEKFESYTMNGHTIPLEERLEIIREMEALIESKGKGRTLFESENKDTINMIKDTLNQIKKVLKSKEVNK